MDTQPIEVLKNVNIDTIEQVIEVLNTDGFITELDKISLSSFLIEKWDDNCTQYLIQKGFKGEKLLTIGKYYKEFGNAYALLNIEEPIYHEVISYLTIQVQDWTNTNPW